MDGSGLAGRESELRVLRSLVADVRHGGAQTVWLGGSAGIGKTTLVRRFLAGVPDVIPLVATADPAAGVEFELVDQLVRQGGPSLRSRVPLLARTIPPGTDPRVVGAYLLELLEIVLAGGAVVVVADDLQWADEGSLRALAWMLQRLDRDRVLTILMFRTALGHGRNPAVERLMAPSHGPVLELGGLPVEGVADMTRSVLRRDVDDATVARLHEQTGGHPQHLRSLLEQLAGDVDEGRLRELPVPRSLAALARRDRAALPRTARGLLDAIAVLNGGPTLAPVAMVADVTSPEVALQRAVSAGLAVLNRGLPPTIHWTEGVHREAVYSALSPPRRSALHSRAADVVEPDAAWAHRVAATVACDDELAGRLEREAERCAAEQRDDLAARYLQWAADLSSTRCDRESRLQHACVHLVLSRDRAQAEQVRSRVRVTEISPSRSAALGMVALLVDGDRPAARQWLAEALQQDGEARSARWVRAVAAAGLAAVSAWDGLTAEALAAARLALSFDELPGRFADYTRVLAATARTRLDGIERGLDELRDVPVDPALTPPEMLDSLACRGALFAMCGQFPAAEADLRAVLGRRRTGTHLMSGAVPAGYLAAVRYVRGDWDDAQFVVGQAAVDGSHEPQARAVLAMCASLVPSGRGDWATADAHIRAARDAADELGSPQDKRYAAIAEAVRCQARADPAGMLLALADLRADVEVAGTHVWWSSWWRPLLVEALIGTNHLDEARAQLAPLRAASTTVPYLKATVVRLTAAAAAREGDRGPALELAGQHLAHRGGVPAPLARGLLEHDHANRLLAARRRTEALALLNIAHDRLVALGAEPFAARVRLDLERCGAAGTVVRRGDGARLTARENQVALLAASGLTNSEIAARLTINARTVEYHLGNVYAKLAITSRRELIRGGEGVIGTIEPVADRLGRG